MISIKFHNIVARCCHVFYLECTIVGDNNLFADTIKNVFALLQCNQHLYQSTLCAKQPNQKYTTYCMLTKLKHTYNLPHVLNTKVDYLHQHLIPIVVQGTVCMLDKHMVFASWHICLALDLDFIVCDIDISFWCCHPVYETWL